MSNYPKFQIPGVVAASGEYTIPPLTPTEAGTGRLSVQEGWGPVNAVPIEQGGIPPHKADFNGVLFLLSQFAVWFQQGGIMNYSALRITRLAMRSCRTEQSTAVYSQTALIQRR